MLNLNEIGLKCSPNGFVCQTKKPLCELSDEDWLCDFQGQMHICKYGDEAANGRRGRESWVTVEGEDTSLVLLQVWLSVVL